MQLAQLNIAKTLYPMEDPRMDGFTSRLATINSLAERADGFVWRLQDEGEMDGATELRLPGTADTLVNMSVWADVAALYRYVYLTAHAKVMRDRATWMVPMNEAYLVLWWVSDGHIPSLVEAAEKLARLQSVGPTPTAFDFTHAFDAAGQPLDLPTIKKRCA